MKVSQPKGGNLLAPSGTIQAVCYGVWDLGEQKTIWQGVDKMKHQLIIGWEINETIEDEGEYKGKRYVVSRRYTASLGTKSNLYKDLTSWRGVSFTKEELQGFDMDRVIGANCLLQIIHNEYNENIYANIDTIMALPKGTPKLEPELSSDPPGWIKEIMDASGEEVAANDFPGEIKNNYDQDLPFD